MSVRSMISASCRNPLVAAFASLALIAASASPVGCGFNAHAAGQGGRRGPDRVRCHRF
ncbi:hypothetical protein ACVWXO_005971 [Bradyrhizobium sp. LM2.7]